jgi:hypothetical protein
MSREADFPKAPTELFRTQVYATYYDKDFRLGLNAAQTTLAATAQLAGATLKKTSP